MSSFYKLLLNRRSVRHFTEQAIETDKIETLKKALLLSPTGKSKNHWEFILIDNKTQLKSLSEAKQFGSKLLENAAIAFVITGDSSVSDTWIEDCSIASILVQMQAEELGLGSCWVQIHKRLHANGTKSEEYVRELLSVPEGKSILSIIAIGYPAKKRAPINESELQYDKIHYGKY